jgi:hypothetical protein
MKGNFMIGETFSKKFAGFWIELLRVSNVINSTNSRLRFMDLRRNTLRVIYR